MYPTNMLRFAIPLTFIAVQAYAQNYPPDVRRADIRGGGGDGKCTVEAVVDGSAEVEISGDTATLRTISGNRSVFRRFQCNRPLPQNPANFRFRGVDGRGRQSLLRQPGRGPAVIRIDDPERGSEGYTFDIEWSDGGRPDGSYSGGSYDRNPGGGFGRNRAEMRRADIRGGGGRGKCTIEVDVDDVAEVEVRGDTAYLRTISGEPAIFRRFVCNTPMPDSPYDFRFSGVDGRGRQTLVRSPRRGGPAVIRIEDRERGREGYTFDIEWR